MPSSVSRGVNPLTSPTSSDSGFFLVNKLMTMVARKQMSQAHQALQKLAAMSEDTSDRVMSLVEIQLNFTPRYMAKDEPIPAMRPQKSASGVIHLTNMPRSMGGNNGAWTQERRSSS